MYNPIRVEAKDYSLAFFFLGFGLPLTDAAIMLWNLTGPHWHQSSAIGR
jgi:hypothetical protein